MVHHGAALAHASGEPSLQEAVASGRFDELDDRLKALCKYAVKLTLHPDRMSKQDIQALRDEGFDDRAIVDANQVVSYFNYVNRVADGLGIGLEEEWPDEIRAPRDYGIRGGSGAAEDTS